MKKLLFYFQIALWRVIYFLQDLPYRWTAGKRLLPNFLIIGVAKGGTTTLFEVLNELPGVQLSRRKEPHFFSQHYEKGINYYRSFFPFKGKVQTTGEASTSYFSNHLVPQRVAQTLTDPKLILLLRDPVKRAYSHYQMLRKSHDVGLSFSDLMDQELRQLTQGQPSQYGLIEKGCYGEALERWLTHFDASSIMIIKSDSFSENPLETLEKVCQFLGVRHPSNVDFSPRNVRDYEPLSEDVYQKYSEVFDADKAKLYDLSGIKI
jgi:hypothetical protein